MTRLLLPAALLLALAPLGLPTAQATDTYRVIVDPAPVPHDDAPVAQVAILLDTSNSMDGLIGQAKAQLWKIVNRVASTTKNGKPVKLQVAIFEYGNSGLPASEGYVRQVQSFTSDLDKVSLALFALKTNGGDEYCGQVIHEAVARLPWNADSGYKAIFICGNEPFTQGEFHYEKACEQAKKGGVIVNTIHCGSREEGVSGHWQDGAILGGGKFFCINQDAALPDIQCPQDVKIMELNRKLNETYIPVGRAGREGLERQARADTANAALSREAGASRVMAKALQSKNANTYDNSSWDLADAYKKDDKAVAAAPAAALPANMQKMDVAAREAYVKDALAKREAIQKDILKLSAEREAYAAKEREKLAGGKKDDSFGAAVLGALDEQMKANGFAPGK